MAHAKLMWIIVDIFGVPISIAGILANLDNVKSLIIFLLAVGYYSTRWYYYVKQKEQSIREKEYELWNKEQDKLERIERHDAKQIHHK